jgi:hypothetical protein
MSRVRRNCEFALGVVSALSLCACPNAAQDSGTDGGVDAGTSYSDGGPIEPTGGCYDRQGGRKFILYFETAGLCAGVSFRRFDGGFEPLFAETTTAPENYLIDDARVGLCSMPIEQANGQLNQNAARVDAFHGVVEWSGFQAGRPWTYSANGSIALFGSEYGFSTPAEGAGLIDPCREP